MIIFSDLTINEANGNYDKVCVLMMQDVGDKWMLRSQATITTPVVVSNLILHFWNDSKVYIKEIIRPPLTTGVPDDDLLELKEWCFANGWKLPIIDSRFTQNVSDFDFWLNKYRSALVDSEEFRKFDEEEMKRMTETLFEEQDEEFYIS